VDATRSWPTDLEAPSSPRFGRSAWFGVALLVLGALTVLARFVVGALETQRVIEGPGAPTPSELEMGLHTGSSLLLYGMGLAVLGLGLLVPSLLRGRETDGT
jgi:hypothetical protein